MAAADASVSPGLCDRIKFCPNTVIDAMPRSYMTNAERDELRADGLSPNGILLAESDAADAAGDREAS